jgi:hypothetical protein
MMKEIKKLVRVKPIRQVCSWYYKNYGNLAAYIRVGEYFHNGQYTFAICIANVSVKPKKQGKGLFTEFLADIEKLGVPVVIENVVAERFKHFLLHKGYKLTQETKDYAAPTMWKHDNAQN